MWRLLDYTRRFPMSPLLIKAPTPVSLTHPSLLATSIPTNAKKTETRKSSLSMWLTWIRLVQLTKIWMVTRHLNFCWPSASNNCTQSVLSLKHMHKARHELWTCHLSMKYTMAHTDNPRPNNMWPASMLVIWWFCSLFGFDSYEARGGDVADGLVGREVWVHRCVLEIILCPAGTGSPTNSIPHCSHSAPTQLEYHVLESSTI